MRIESTRAPAAGVAHPVPTVDDDPRDAGLDDASGIDDLIEDVSIDGMCGVY